MLLNPKRRLLTHLWSGDMNKIIPALPLASDQSGSNLHVDASSASGSSITVFIVDDHPAVCEAVASRVESAEGVQIIGSANSAQETLASLNGQAPDVVVVDISLADGNGLTLVGRIQSRAPEARVLIYSMYNERMYAGQSLQAGARGFVPKSAPTSKIITAIHTVHRGDVYMSNHMRTKIVGAALRRGTYEADPREQLTDRELTVFKMIGAGKSMREIATLLDLSRKTVETYRRRAKEKLGYETVEELLRFAVLWVDWEYPETMR